VRVRSTINQVTVPEWAREWGSPQDTAARIARLPQALAEVAKEQWHSACEELARTPGGQGLRDQVIRGFNSKLRETLEAAGTLARYGVSATASHEDVQHAAKDLANCAIGLLSRPAGAGGWKSFARKRGLDPSDPADILRAQDPTYWRHQIRTTVWRARERLWLNLAPEKIEKWCSDDCFRNWSEDQEKQAEWAAKQVLVGRDLDQHYDPEEGVYYQVESQKDGEKIKLSDLSVGRERRQFARLMTFSNGMHELALEEGLEPYFVTITPPADQHASTTAGGPRQANPNWDGSDARDQHKTMCKQWRGCRVALSRIDKPEGEKRGAEGKYYIRSVQPQKSGSAHWHMTIWSKNIAEVEATIRRYFKAEEGDGFARYQHGVVVEKVENGVQGVMAYLARALGYMLRALGPDATDKDVEEARRTAAWARTNSIRRFQASHTATTLWNMIYSGQVCLGKDHPAQQAVTGKDEGDEEARRGHRFAKFYRAVEEEGLQPAYIEIKTRYGEASRKVIGIKNAAGTTWVKTKIWTMQREEKTLNDGLVALVHINQEGTRTREEGEITHLDNRVDAGELAGGAPPEWSGHGNNETEPTEQAARRAIFAAELEAEVAAWC